jgi:hypothetical protein
MSIRRLRLGSGSWIVIGSILQTDSNADTVITASCDAASVTGLFALTPGIAVQGATIDLRVDGTPQVIFNIADARSAIQGASVAGCGANTGRCSVTRDRRNVRDGTVYTVDIVKSKVSTVVDCCGQ